MGKVTYNRPDVFISAFRVNKQLSKSLTATDAVRADRFFTLKKDPPKNNNTYLLKIIPSIQLLFNEKEVAFIKITGKFKVVFEVEEGKPTDDIPELIECVKTMFNTTYEVLRQNMNGTIFEKLNTVFVTDKEVITRLRDINTINIPPDYRADLN